MITMGFRDNWKYLFVGSVCCIGIILLAVIFGFGSSDVNTSSDTNDPFNGNNARLENVSISSSYGYFDVSGKIMFKHDESYASLAADVNLNDGSKISESIVKNWNDVKKDQWYKFDGILLFGVMYWNTPSDEEVAEQKKEFVEKENNAI